MNGNAASEVGERSLGWRIELLDGRVITPDELYGQERVRQSFAQPAPSAEMIVQNVIWDMHRFVGLQRRTDDVTVIAVRVL